MITSKADQDFLDRIEAFMAKYDYRPSEFGRRSIGDPNFVQRLRRGERSPTLRLVDRINQWMDQGETVHRNRGPLPEITPKQVRKNANGKLLWTRALDATIRRLAGQGVPWSEIGLVVGASTYNVRRRAEELGLIVRRPQRQAAKVQQANP